MKTLGQTNLQYLVIYISFVIICIHCTARHVNIKYGQMLVLGPFTALFTRCHVYSVQQVATAYIEL